MFLVTVFFHYSRGRDIGKLAFVPKLLREKKSRLNCFEKKRSRNNWQEDNRVLESDFTNSNQAWMHARLYFFIEQSLREFFLINSYIQNIYFAAV